ncbi:hypothetical protein ACP4OV_016188 [Aristida adscensionis]
MSPAVSMSAEGGGFPAPLGCRLRFEYNQLHRNRIPSSIAFGVLSWMDPTWGRLALSDSRPSGETAGGGGAGSAKSEPAVSLSDGSIALLADGEGSSYHFNDNSQAGNGMGYSGPYLP